LTADRIVAQIITDHPASPGKYAPKVCFVGTRFENLKIGGCPVDVTLNFDLCKPEKLGDNNFPATRTMEDKSFLDRIRQQGDPYGNFGATGRGYIQCSLVEKATPTGNLPGSGKGNVFHIPEFGKITLAELIVDCNSYRLSMIRLELGCPTKGKMSAGNARANGSTYP
jgi:hypothetical protein